MRCNSRELPNAGPSTLHLPRYRTPRTGSFARLIYGTRVSLLLAPAAALVSTLIAGVFGGFAGLVGGWSERLILAAADLSMALPLLFCPLGAPSILPLIFHQCFGHRYVVSLGLLGWPLIATRSLGDCTKFSELRLSRFGTRNRMWPLEN